MVVVELKRDRAPRDAIAQALEYASYAAGLDTQHLESILRCYQQDDSLVLAECHRRHFDLGQDEAVSFNKDQRIVIIGQHMTPGIKQTAEFLNTKGVRVTCIEFAFYRGSDENRLMTQRIVVGEEARSETSVSSGSGRKIDKDEFLASCDDNGKNLYSQMLSFAESGSLDVRWSAKGFSLNVILNWTFVPVCYGSSPEAWFGQMLYTAFHGRGCIIAKVDLPENAIQSLIEQAKSTGLFEPAGKKDLKCLINRMLTDTEVESLFTWCESAEEAIQEYWLK